MSKANSDHLTAAKRIVKYLAGTTTYGLFYSQENDACLEGFTDSNWGGSLCDQKSTSGMFFRLGSSAITWGSRKQDVVALSTMEAEYMVATSVACHLVWLKRILSDCGKSSTKSTVLWYGNQSTTVVEKNLALHGRTNRIDVRFHFIQSLVTEGLITL